jgi:hypothetical protein
MEGIDRLLYIENQRRKKEREMKKKYQKLSSGKKAQGEDLNANSDNENKNSNASPPVSVDRVMYTVSAIDSFKNSPLWEISVSEYVGPFTGVRKMVNETSVGKKNNEKEKDDDEEEEEDETDTGNGKNNNHVHIVISVDGVVKAYKSYSQLYDSSHGVSQSAELLWERKLPSPAIPCKTVSERIERSQLVESLPLSSSLTSFFVDPLMMLISNSTTYIIPIPYYAENGLHT